MFIRIQYPTRLIAISSILALLGVLIYVSPVQAGCSIETFTANPSSPQTVGVSVTLYAKANCGGGVRAIRFKVDGNIIYELGAPEATATWNTGGVSPGTHILTVEAAEQGDNNWNNPATSSLLYQLNPGNPPTNTPIPTPSCEIQAFSVSPPSPQAPGVLVSLYGRASCNTGVRAIRFKVDGNIIYELGAPEATATWNTGGVSPGTYILTVEAAGWGDNSWVYAASQSTYYTLQQNQQLPTATPTLRPTNTPPPTTKSWTFMLYLAGDNNLYPHLQRAIAQLEAQPANPDLNILVLFDGDRPNDSWRFLVQPGGNYTIGVNKWYLGELNMGDPQTLIEFINWTRQNYPAQYYYLAIADHGRGTSGVAWDDASNHDNLTTAELRTALRTATNSGMWKINVLHYDTCLMALLENAYQVREYADYMVASQNLGWSVFSYSDYARVQGEDIQAMSAPYEFAALAAKTTASTTPRQLAVNVAHIYFNHPAIQAHPRTISALDLSRAVTVREALDNLAKALRSNLQGVKTYVQNARYAVQKFDSRDYYKINQEDEYVDLYHLAALLKQYVPDSAVQNAAQGVMDAMNGGFIVAEHHQSGMWGEEELYWDLDNAHGVSLYFPPRSGSNDYNRYVSHQLFQFTADGVWDEFLVDYFGVMGLPPEEPSDSGLPPMLAPEHKVYLPLVLRNR